MPRYIARAANWTGFTEIIARNLDEARYEADKIYGDFEKDGELTVELYDGRYDWEPERQVKRGRPREKR